MARTARPMARAGFTLAAVTAVLVPGCETPAGPAPATEEFEIAAIRGLPGSSPFTRFEGLTSSAVCTVDGGNPAAPLVLPAAFTQTIIASEPDFADLPDMNTVNETGPNRNQYLYRTHEVGSNGSVSVTELETGLTSTLAQRADWERLDGIVWTPWGTILVAEETTNSSLKDPDLPAAVAGHVYEIDPTTGAATLLRYVGSRSHEGLGFDDDGNLYGISETTPGYIYKFVPTTPGDLTDGTLYALKVTSGEPERIGAAVWVELDKDAAALDSDAAAAAAGATGYGRPEDVEVIYGTLFVAITSEDRVIGINFGDNPAKAFVFDFVRKGMNVSSDFDSPDNLGYDRYGTLYITEDPGGNFPAKTTGDDVWAAALGRWRSASPDVRRFATIDDCDAEPTGVYFNVFGSAMFLNIQHRGGTGEDLSVRIRRP